MVHARVHPLTCAACARHAQVGWQALASSEALVVPLPPAEGTAGAGGPLRHAFSVRLCLGEVSLDEDDGAEQMCEAGCTVLEDLLDASADELARLSPEEQRRRLGRFLWQERLWALTRAAGPAGAGSTWRVNLSVEVPPPPTC